MRVLQRVYVFWYDLMFQIILTHLVHEGEQVECMLAGSLPLDLVDQLPRFDVRVKFDGVSQFPHPCVLDDTEDEVHSLSPCRLICGSIHYPQSVLCLHLCAHRILCVVFYRFIVCTHPLGYNELFAVQALIIGRQFDDPNEIVLPLRLIEHDLK